MKKVVSTLVSAAMLACMMPVTTTAFAADLSACDFKVTADKTAVHPGDTVTFTLTVTPTGDLYGISAGFDIPEGLTFQEAALADGLKDSLNWDFLDPPGAAAELFFGGTASKPYTAGTALVVGTYTCVADANLTTGTVSLTGVAATNGDYDEIANVTSNTVTIKAPELIQVAEKESTCTVHGNNEYWKCSDDCGKVYKSDKTTLTTVAAEELPLKDHSFTAEKAEEKFLSTPANCKDPAKYFKSCAVCGEKGTETFESGTADKTKHGETELKNKKEATCSDKGYTGDEVCKLCGDIVKKGTDIPATGKHTGGKATCSKKAVCDNCGKEYGDLDPDNHEDVTLTGKEDPTCTKPGNTGSGTCSACGNTVEGTEIPALGHKGGTATCNKKAVCDTCKEEYGEFDKNNHGDNGTEIQNAKEATETADGYTGDTVCKGCGTVLKKGTVTKSKPTVVGTVTFPSSSNGSGASGNGNSGASGNAGNDTSSSATNKPSNNTSSDTGANTNNNKPSSNPATGITVTVIPMVIAAGAAVIIAKNKRK